jgi:hypothetical protein
MVGDPGTHGCKDISFPYLYIYTAFPRRLLHRGAIKLAVAPALPISSCMIFHHIPASFPMAKKKDR